MGASVTTESPDTMYNPSDTVDPYQGESIPIRFLPHVEPTGDPHRDLELLDKAERNAVVYTLRTRVLKGARFEALQAEHPPKVRGHDVDPDTFYPALIAESVSGWTVTQTGTTLEHEDRAPTVVEAVELWESWPDWARREIRTTLVAQNRDGPALGKARLRLNASAARPPTGTGF